VSPATTGAALLLGSSIGGELLNPGAPELGTISRRTEVPVNDIVARIFPLDMIHLATATLTFWWLSLRHEAACRAENVEAVEQTAEGEPVSSAFRLRLDKALVPLIPLALLFVVGPPLSLWTLPLDWLADPKVPGDDRLFNSRLIGAAMLVGVGVAALTSPVTARDTAKAFFEGAGYAFTHIIALIVTASCFGKGVELVGLAARLGQITSALPHLLIPLAGLLPWAFAFLSGSGMAATQSLFGFFDDAARAAEVESVAVGVVVAIGSAAGRTMSPVAAVTLMCSALSGVEPMVLVRRVAVPLFVGMAVVVACSMFLVQ
jgi:DcuC family C4-dicarboxylate transporter